MIKESVSDVLKMSTRGGHIAFLWETKLKSRASFLSILEFMEVSLKTQRTILMHLNPTDGNAVYERYVRGSFQFFEHAQHTDELCQIGHFLDFDKIKMGWFPC
jgi:hypothetical protein